MSQDIFRVSEINQFIRDVLTSGFPQPLWITGEIQGFNRNKTKRHVFFELIEKDQNSQDIKARIGLVIFANRKAFIQSVLKRSENAFDLKDDIEVKLACRIDFYAPHGAVRLIVENIDPVYTLGKLAQEKQRLIALLKKKGLLDQNKKQLLPLVPLRIGLITSADSAAYNDFVNELTLSGIGFSLQVRNTVMQGKNAELDVCKALKFFHGNLDVDVVVITRGGGSVADLSCFDSQKIVEFIAKINKPVLTGIGHEIDTSITDLAAHTIAKTPTAIAQFLITHVEKYKLTADQNMLRLKELCEAFFSTQQSQLKDQAYALQKSFNEFIQTHRYALLDACQRLKHGPELQIERMYQCLSQLQFALTKSPLTTVMRQQYYLADCVSKLGFVSTIAPRQQKQRLKNNLDQLLRVLEYHLQKKKDFLNQSDRLVAMSHPQRILKRGFSITRDDSGCMIKDATLIKNEQLIETQVFQGSIKSQVIETSPEDKMEKRR